MAETATRYRKLPGRAAVWGGYARLWLGTDHLLQAEVTLGVERYRRFFFRDIRALVVRRTRTRRIVNLSCGAWVLFCALIGAILWWLSEQAGGATGTAEFNSVLFRGLALAAAAFGAPFLLVIVVNTLLGPTCTCYVATSTGQSRLTLPRRLRPARRLIARLAPVISGAHAETQSAP